MEEELVGEKDICSGLKGPSGPTLDPAPWFLGEGVCVLVRICMSNAL